MKTLVRKRNSGITLIELMIVQVIAAILPGLAYPSCMDFVRKSTRGAAQPLLPSRSATLYTPQAAAAGEQVNDEAKDGTDCTPMTLEESGVKSPAVCWA